MSLLHMAVCCRKRSMLDFVLSWAARYNVPLCVRCTTKQVAATPLHLAALQADSDAVVEALSGAWLAQPLRHGRNQCWLAWCCTLGNGRCATLATLISRLRADLLLQRASHLVLRAPID